MSPNLTVRAPEVWLQELDSTIEALRPALKVNRSKGVRHLLERESFILREAPYLIRRQELSILVAASGDMAYHSWEEVLLQRHRERLPCSIEMKPEKVLDYAAQVDAESRLAGTLRDKWLLNYFGAYQGSELIADHCDGVGLTRKQADLEVNLPQDTLIEREVVAVNEDYVQRRFRDDDRTDARSEILIAAPTLNLTLNIIVDLGVYGDDRLRGTAALDHELRNAEGALLQSRDYRYGDNTLTWIAGRVPLARGSRHQQVHDGVAASVKRLVERVHELRKAGKAPLSGGVLFHSQAAEERLRQLSLPSGPYLFGRLAWPFPPMGIEICATWNKPPGSAASSSASS